MTTPPKGRPESGQTLIRAEKRTASQPVRNVNSGAANQGSATERDYAGLLEYWQMVRRHKQAVILCTLLGGVIGFLQTLPAPRMYGAHTSMEIQGLNEDFLNMRNVNPTSVAGGGSYDPSMDIQTQIRILQSRTLLRRTAQKLEEHKNAAGLQPPDRLGVWRKALHLAPPGPDQLWAQAMGSAMGNLRIRTSGTTRIVELSTESTNPRIAAEALNTLVVEFIEENLESRWKTTEHTGEWLTKQLQDIKIKLEKGEDELQAYARSTGLVMTSEKTNADESKLTDMQKALSDAHNDRITKQSKYEMAISSPPEALPDVLDDTALQQSQQSISELRRQLAQLRTTYTADHSEVKRVQAQITSIESGLQKQRENIFARIRNEFEYAKRREDLLASSYGSQAQLVSEEADKAAHYNLLKREVDTNRLLYETMLQKLKEASISSALRASNIRVVDSAEPSGLPSKPDISRSVEMGVLTGAFLGIMFAVLRERADRTLQDPGDTSYYLKLPELGVIPAAALLVPGGKNLTLANGNSRRRVNSLNGASGATLVPSSVEHSLEKVSWTQKTSLLAESFRTTATSILFSERDGVRPRVIVLTSASPKEGKTTVSSNLAIVMAEINHRTLLIDGDMRRPRMHRIFNVENTRGLSDLLNEKQPLTVEQLSDVVQATEVSGLYLMASGSSRHNISSALHSERLAEIVQLAREEFDMVLIDTPPMVNISDARVIAHYADGLVVVVRSATTTRDAALLAKQRFADDGLPILGTILNGWNPNTPGYGYYRTYYAGYYHYYGNGNGNSTHEDGA
jgi:polysaccharide biosynthesis transport protein